MIKPNWAQKNVSIRDHEEIRRTTNDFRSSIRTSCMIDGLGETDYIDILNLNRKMY